MPNGKCTNEKLLKEGDFNVRLTVYPPNMNKQEWLELIKNALGNGITNNSNRFKVTVTNSNGRKVFNRGVIEGKLIMEVIDVFIKNIENFRIDIAKTDYKATETSFSISNVEKPRTWVFKQTE